MAERYRHLYLIDVTSIEMGTGIDSKKFINDRYVGMMVTLNSFYPMENFVYFSHGRALLTYTIMRLGEPKRTWSISHRDSFFYVESGEKSIPIGEGEYIEHLPYSHLYKDVSVNCSEILPHLDIFLDIDHISDISSFLRSIGYNELEAYVTSRNIQYPMVIYLYGLVLSIIKREIPPGVHSVPTPRYGIYARIDIDILTYT